MSAHTAPCESYGLVAQHPDEFLTHAVHINGEQVVSALARQAAAKQNPPISFDQLLSRLTQTVPVFVGEVRDLLRELKVRDPARLQRLLTA